MKRLEDILPIEEIVKTTGPSLAEVEIDNIQFDSRKVNATSVFFAYKGVANDGHDYIPNVIEAGVRAVVCGELPKTIEENVCYVQVTNPSKVLGITSHNFYDCPSEKLKLVGVTGTNGKTTVATLLYEQHRLLGHSVGLLSTVRNIINGEKLPATHTTPDAVSLNALMARMVEAGCTHCFMEVSSHALDQNRTAGLVFTGAIFTNISHDHLDYHHTFDAYIAAKQKLFNDLPMDAFALYNKDDRNGAVMVQNSKATKYSYGIKSGSDFKAKIIEQDLRGMLLQIDKTEAWFNMVGTFNAYNVLAVYAATFLLDPENDEIITTLTRTKPVDGRFEVVRSKDSVTGVIDYAHTPDALLNVLTSINAVRTRNEQLICVVGCGGERDKEKRPVMAKVACLHAERVIITSDNPRSEDPSMIIEDMMKGVPPEHYKKVLQIEKREEAIKTAITLANPGDIILVAGKGHEKYQEINGVKHPFDDLQIVVEQFEKIRS